MGIPPDFMVIAVDESNIYMHRRCEADSRNRIPC